MILMYILAILIFIVLVVLCYLIQDNTRAKREHSHININIMHHVIAISNFLNENKQ